MLKITPRQIVAGVGTGLLAGMIVAALELDIQGQICEYNQATEHEDCSTYSLFPFLLIQVFNTLNYYGVAITALATVAIGVFTLTLKLSTDRLWDAGEKQRKLSEDTATQQLRAYVFIQHGVIKLINDDTAIMADITLKNFGATPGYDFKSWTNIRIGNPTRKFLARENGRRRLPSLAHWPTFLRLLSSSLSLRKREVRSIMVLGQSLSGERPPIRMLLGQVELSFSKIPMEGLR